MIDPTAEALRGLVSHFGKLYPDCYKRAEKLRNDLQKDKVLGWPEWSYCSMMAFSHLIFEEHDDPEQASIERRNSPDKIKSMQLVSALAAWRITQGIYRFDSDLGRSLIETPWTGKMIPDPFLAMPEFCIYIEHPAYTELRRIWGQTEDLGPFEGLGDIVRGFFVQLDYENFKGYPLLRVILDQTSTFLPFTIPLGEWTLAGAMDQLEMSHLEAFLYTRGDIPDKFYFDERFAEHVGHLISLCYYICSQNAEIGTGADRPTKPEPTKTKKGLRYFPADKPRVWTIGSRIGAALRASKEKREQQERTGPSQKQENAQFAGCPPWGSMWSTARSSQLFIR